MTSDYEIAQSHFEKQEDLFKEDKDRDIVWSGEVENCDVCSRPMYDQKYMIDGPSEASKWPRWGNLCVKCAYKSSPVIGWGSAQLYKMDGTEWRLVAGGSSDEDEGIFE